MTSGVISIIPAGYTISGNAGIAGATLSYTDGTAQTATADGSGNYSLFVSANWSGTVTPSYTGYTFTPANRIYANVLANQTSQDYTAAVITYTISGNAGIAGATLSYTDGTPKTATADGSGNYSFTVSYNWSGTVTPSLTGYAFTPANRAYTNVLSNQTGQDYTAAPITYAISGDAGIAGATLSYTDGTPKTATADGSGNYSFTVSYNWSGTVTPSLTGYAFTPANRSYTNVLSNQTGQDYTAMAITFSISGNAGIAGATLSYTDGTPKTASADGSGNYSFSVSYNWSGTVTPSLTGYAFTPANRIYANVLANQTSQDYTAAVITYTISGNAGIAGATLSYTDGTPKTATADGSGNYSFTVSYNWSGTVTPSSTGYSFTPANRTYANVLSNQASQDYTAALINYTVDFVTDGTPGATLTGITSQTVSHGSNCTAVTVNAPVGYQFTGWSGGYTGTANPLTITNVTADMTVTANFAINQYTVTFQTDGTTGATLTGNASQTVSYGGDCSAVTANAPAGYHFFNWTATDEFVSTDNPLVIINVKADMQLTANFAINTYTVSGTITVGTSPLANVSMEGVPGNPTTDASGFYTAAVEHGWTGTVTPVLAGYGFTPPNRPYADVTSDQTGQDYSAALTNGVAVTAPNGGESWPLGSSQAITWNCLGVAGNARLVLFRNSVKVGVIATVPVTQKSYNWAAGSFIGGTAVAAKNYKIKVVTVDGMYSDYSDANFTLSLDPYVRVVAPNGGESWAAGGVRAITWASRGVSGNVRLMLYDGGAKVGVISTQAASLGSYDWTVGSYIGGMAPVGSNYRIKVISQDNVNMDYSDSPFAITAAGGGLLAFYPLDGDGKDASGNGLAATLRGAVLAANDRFGYLDGSLTFDGDSGRAEVRLRENEPLIGEEGFAVSGWIKTGAKGKAQGIWSVLDASGWLALELGADRRPVLRLANSKSELRAAEPLAVGRWVFVVAQFDSRTNRSRLYVDGILAVETIHMPILPGSGRIVRLGHSPAAGYLNAALDDFRLYDRPFADEEIAGLLNEKRVNGDLLSYYPLDGDARDHSGNERHGEGVVGTRAEDRWERAGAALRGEGLSLPAVAAGEMAGGFTMNVWLRPDGLDRWQTLFGAEGSDLVLRLTPENNLELELAGERRELGTLAAKGWVMVTLVGEAEERQVEAYLNGKPLGSLAWPGAGMFNSPWLAEFAGAVDDARFYQRALTAAEVAAHFAERN